jgi:phage internal scaffolding protein
MAIDEFDSVTPDLYGVKRRFSVMEGEIYVPPFNRSAYNYDTDVVSVETGLDCCDPSLTQQHMAEDADINELVRRFGLTGKFPESHRVPQYGDFVGISDYRAALAAIDEADDQFFGLPADLRSRFDNDPARYMDFATNPANQEEIYALGLAERPRGAPIPSTDAPQAPKVDPGSTSGTPPPTGSV